MIRPIQPFLPDSGATITVVADGELADAPLSALIDSITGKYIVERWALRNAATLEQAQQRVILTGRPAEILLVADPAFDQTSFPRLTRLPEARREVRDIAPLYQLVVLLEDSAANLQSVERFARTAQVIHFAGHARFDSREAEKSGLLLSDLWVANTSSLERLQLNKSPLVILSACESTRESVGRSSGFSGIAAVLRQRGARAVVGGQWAVNDADARVFFRKFHESYVQHPDPARALRAAQLSALHSDEPLTRSPATWAGYRAIGL